MTVPCPRWRSVPRSSIDRRNLKEARAGAPRRAPKFENLICWVVNVCILGFTWDFIRPSPGLGGSGSRRADWRLTASTPMGGRGYESETRIFTRLAQW